MKKKAHGSARTSEKKSTFISQLLDESEKLALQNLYLSYAVPTDRFPLVPDVLRELYRAFVNATGRDDVTQSEMYRYMVNRRKCGDWPCLGANAIKFESIDDLLTPGELGVLEAIYMEMDVTSDEYLFAPRTRAVLAREFRQRTGKQVAGSLLAAAIMVKRKRREWVKIRPAGSEFGDVAMVKRKFGT